MISYTELAKQSRLDMARYGKIWWYPLWVLPANCMNNRANQARRHLACGLYESTSPAPALINGQCCHCASITYAQIIKYR